MNTEISDSIRITIKHIETRIEQLSGLTVLLDCDVWIPKALIEWNNHLKRFKELLQLAIQQEKKAAENEELKKKLKEH